MPYNLTMQRLTGRQVAEILGVDSHTPPRWAARGLLPMRTKTRTAHGTAVVWRCELAVLEQFIERHPEAFAWRRIAEEPYRSMGQRAHAQASYVRLSEAAGILGVDVE